MKLIATLEDLFEQGVETLPELVSGAERRRRMHDPAGRAVSDASFQHPYRLTATEGKRDDDDRTDIIWIKKRSTRLWYPVLASWEVQSAPVGITRLGEQIVVWRNKDGQVQALEDRCRTAVRACRWVGTWGTHCLLASRRRGGGQRRG